MKVCEKVGLEEEQLLGAGFGPGEAAGAREVDRSWGSAAGKVVNIGRLL